MGHPPRTSASVRGLHPHSHREVSLLQYSIEGFGLLAMCQAVFAQFTCIGIDARNLLEARMVITPYNQHVRLLSSEPFGWFAPPKSTRAWEPTLFMESFHSSSLGCDAKQKPPMRTVFNRQSKTHQSAMLSIDPVNPHVHQLVDRQIFHSTRTHVSNVFGRNIVDAHRDQLVRFGM